MEDPSITKRLIDFGADEHDYDEVQDLPEESTANNQSLLSSNNNNSASISECSPKTGERESFINNNLVPELPLPKQSKNSLSNTKSSKTKSSKASKSKIPRSPSLASTLGYNNFQPPPISGIPPQTPPLPLAYQNKGKTPNSPTTPLDTNNANFFGSNHTNVMAGGNSANSGGSIGLSSTNGSAQRNSLNMAANSRRSQTQISSPVPGESPKNFQFLTLTVRKDENGYGMKVSGDNPVFVESVKPGGAAQIAGLVAGDMILKVNGTEVRSEKHPTVVSLIKASTIVELAVKRSQKMARPTSVGVVPSTPVLGRDRTASITGPQPVDSIKRREMETYKIKTLQKMLEQELLNLERLKGDTNNAGYKTSEANIKTLREQLRCAGAESLHNPQQMQPQRNSAQQLFHMHQQQLQQLQQQPSKTSSKSSKGKNKFSSQSKNVIEEDDVPPPLPQRNPPRQINLDASNNNSANHSFSPISDLDNAGGGTNSPVRHSPQPPLPSANNSPQNASNKSKRSKAKTKALSDPKMSTQMFLQMESAGSHSSGNDGTQMDELPPPLPPRQPGMIEEPQTSVHRGSNQNLTNVRPSPNSVDTLMQYPLVSTCTPVHRDNMSAAFPFSQRPNIVQQLQQHQQQQQHQQMHHITTSAGSNAAALGQTPQNVNHMNKHRRVVSSPENMHPRHPDRHIKTNSGSWELLEKEDEVTPPGTPPPPYRHAHSASLSGNEDGLHEHGGASTSGICIESHQFTPLGIASSPPPLPHSSRIQAAQTSCTQKEIISMEDEDASDQEGQFIDENGPFNSLQRLLENENVAFLAVFLNFVLSNSEPAPLLFYLITGLYKEGTAKDMRKWVYEIHSTFLVPRAPLSWYRQDEMLAREVDAVLQNEFDKVEILRKVFWKSRKKARDVICEQLREFQQKRTAGLGTIYGPTDAQLTEAKGDKQREQQIFEETLMKKLQILIDEYEKDLPAEDPKKLALCSALSTVIHRIFITRSHPNSIIDRVHHFVSREKSFKSRLMGKKGKMIVRGHPLVLRQYYEVTHCNHCQTIIWGVSPQGFHCTDCKLNIHRPCSKILEENCPGPLPQAKRKDKDLNNDSKISKLIMGKIRPKTSVDASGDKRQRQDPDDFDPPLDFGSERLNSTSIQRQPSDRRTDAANISIRSNGNTSAHLNVSDLQSSFNAGDLSLGAVGGSTGLASSTDVGQTTIGAATTTGTAGVASPAGVAGALSALNSVNAQDANESNILRRERLQQQHQQNKSAPVSVNRSESYKERLSHKRNRSQRKTSDPNLTSRPNDDQPDLGLSNANFTASSNSSLSSGGGSESPSTSMEQMGSVGANTSANGAMPMHQHQQHHHQHQHSHQDSFHGSIGGSSNTSFLGGSVGGSQMARHWNVDSDEEDDLVNESDWSSNVAAEVLAALTDAEKKRQEIVNEIYQTERSHVRTLKLLECLFFYPLQESGLLTYEDLQLLFPPSLRSLCDLHGSFEQKIKQRRIDHSYIVNNIGDILAGMFDGKSGEELREYAAQFCARQQIALEALKEKRRKDDQLQKLLSKAESHKACRRLQLKDLLPTVLQRLTKYPLLFENLYKVTVRVMPEDTVEAEAIQRALESSKKILVDVNQAVKTAEDAHKLQNIQRKLDKSTFDKDEFKNLDLTQYRLIHDGSLTMKKNPSIQLHGLLFETMIVLLTKQDDKYSLKYLHATRSPDVNNKPVSPIMSIDSETLVRQEAADKNSFFLIKTKTSQMLELRAPSSSECKTWFKHISDAAEQYKPRSKNANQEPVDDPAIATLPHSNTRESLELTPERPPPLSATATVVTTPLAPLMPVPGSGSDRIAITGQSNDVQLRNGRRESTPGGTSTTTSDSYPPYYNIKQRLSHNELSTNSNAVNRTMSTRSCGDANHNYSNTGDIPGANGVTLRHTQSARQANGSPDDSPAGPTGNKRDSASIVYSNNSNNTRTLMQSSPPLVEPTAIQISISPAHTAEPVLTSAEKLRRLDASIRDGLLEKQKIICDMFRIPVEHFHEIVDIAAMPEAPKDSTDIALAAYAQVQSLTEVLNEYMKVTPEQEVSAVSTAVCDKCHERQQPNRPRPPCLSKVETSCSDVPPPLPPPNKQTAQAQQQTPAPLATKIQMCALEETNIHEDDDGYCEIDELRLPALPPLTKTTTAGITTPPTKAPMTKPTAAKKGSPPPPLPPPAGSFKAPPPPPPPPPPAKSTAVTATNAEVTATTATTAITSPELKKRQSTVSADSIPEESADEVTHALKDRLGNEKPDGEQKTTQPLEDVKSSAINVAEQGSAEDNKAAELKELQCNVDFNAPLASIDDEEDKDDDSAMHTAECESISMGESLAKQSENIMKTTGSEPEELNSPMTAEPQRQNSNATQADDISLNSERIEVNEVYDLVPGKNAINDSSAPPSTVDSSTQTMPLTEAPAVTSGTPSTINYTAATNTITSPTTGPFAVDGHLPTLCGPNRIQHANSLEPSVPCYALSSIVSSLNAQISLLLPKINERDMERERLRKENQHLRELLNAMHERQRVESKLETPTDVTLSADIPDNETDIPSPTTSTTPTPTPTTTTATTTSTLIGPEGEAEEEKQESEADTNICTQAQN
ncbi:rho guanine nucleotide exchange factor 2 isoform X2 [Musca autumnalis]|uniref:rho guanine nucleotide exchange factor 2 isoform X2 n=1 Tax=Musca autumnalis TaxID=221902 RepID=UPI003CE85B28